MDELTMTYALNPAGFTLATVGLLLALVWFLYNCVRLLMHDAQDDI